MARDFPEADWKAFRDLRTVALERFCDGTLAEVNRISSDLTKTAHDRYVEIYRLIERRDRELARAFDAPRRSQAMSQLALISSLGLLTPEELSRFTPATRDSIITVAEIFQQPRQRGRR
jgi:hypothetical protein